MNRRMILSAAISLIVLAGGRAFGDAAGDLAAGQAALAVGDAAKALPLLESAAQALPQSVEAQFALARAYLLTGDLDKAVERLRAVLRLSPEHVQAKALFEGLTGRRKTFDERLAYVRMLLDLGLYGPAHGEAQRLIGEPLDAAQRLAARMVLVDALLWNSFSLVALPTILQAVQEAAGTPSEGPARVMAALALVTSDKAEDRQSAREMLAKAGDLKEPHSRWAQAARLLLDLAPANAAETSTALLEPLLLPPGGYREGHTDRLVRDLLQFARSAADEGNTVGALKIIWPMLSKTPMPAVEALAAARPAAPGVDLKTGWLRLGDAKTPPHLEPVLATLATIARSELQKDGPKATLVGYVVAAEILRQAGGPDPDVRRALLGRRVGLAAELGNLSRPAPDRKAGAVLSRADALQRAWIDELAAAVTDEGLRDQLVGVIVGQIGRYERADDLEAGLTQFVRVEKGGDVVTVTPSLPAGPASQKLLGVLAAKYAQVGQAEVAREGWRATYLAHCVAANLLRQIIVQDVPPQRTAIVQFGALAAEVGNLSRPAPDRKAGAVLSRADELQRAWIDELAALAPDEGVRDHVVGLITGQIDRYERADDLETGLARFVRFDEKAGTVTVSPAVAVGPARHKLYGHLVTKSAQLAQAEVAEDGWKATLSGYRMAAALLRGMLGPDLEARRQAVGRWLNVAAELGNQSRPAPDRKKGAVLSRADELQRAWIDELADLVSEDPHRVQLVDIVVAHIERYKKAGDPATGLGLFVTAPKPEAKAVEVAPTVAMGPARQKLLAYLAAECAQAGQKIFAEAPATLDPAANKTLNAWDLAAILLCAALDGEFPAAGAGRATAQSVIERYAGAQRWDAALNAAATYYIVLEGSAGKWGVVHLKLRQGMAEEDKRLAANQGLGKTLNPYVAEAVKQARGILLANLDEPTRDRVVALADPLVWRYVGLDRYDLAQAVIDTVSPPSEEAVFAGPAARVWLTEWPIWMKALLAERQGDAALAAAAKEFDGVEKLTLQPEHKTSLDLQNELITKNPASPVMHGRVEHLLAIPNRYRQYKAYDVAAAILTDFIKAHPNLTATERVTFIRVEVLLDKARQAFALRPDKEKPPAAVSAEYAAAIDAIADFIQAHPTGDYALGAENLLVNVARTYGEAGAWPITRAVLARFKAAVPDFRSPERLTFLEAVTYLGELDGAHGLQLLTPPPPPGMKPVSGTTSTRGGPEDLTVAGDRFKVYDVRDLAVATGTPGPADQPAEEGHPRTPAPTGPSGRESWDEADQVLARVRQSEQQQVQRIAMLERGLEDAQVRRQGQPAGQQGGQAAPQQQEVVLPEGPVLSEAELKRQDAAADAAYKILIELVRAGQPTGSGVAAEARAEVVWLIGFFEAQRRTDRAVAMIERFLTDRPTDGGRVALAYRALVNRLSWAGQRRPAEKVDQAWVDARHALFEEARGAIAAFIKTYEAQRDWVHRAQMLAVTSLQQEANLAAAVSAPRAGGLWAQSARAVIDLSVAVPDHPERADFPAHLWTIADRLSAIGQQEQAIYVLSQIVVRFPSDARATQAVMRIAQLHARNLAAPLKAVETYQEYLSLTGDDASVRSQIHAIAEQLAAQKRYLEALHVYGVFVDGFPTDNRAPQALLSMGRIHQSNQAWDDAMQTYRRILDEYESVPQVPEVKLAIAECQINLSLWSEARRLYQDFLQAYPNHAGAATARPRLDVLKGLERYETLLADKQVTRNKDDAQFQIARIVQEKLGYQVKAVAEYRKVLSAYPASHLADDAQLEIGKALIDLDRLDEARAELWKVVSAYATSPLADNALYLIGQSYERQAERLAAVTLKGAREAAFEAGQRGAYGRFQYQVAEQQKDIAERRKELRQAGKGEQLELEEAYSASRFNTMNEPNVILMTREAEMKAETESALQVANRQDRVNEAYRQAVSAYGRAAADYPLGDATDESLLRMAQIFETDLKDSKAAMETYQKVVKFFPGTPVAEDAAWKVATFHEQEGQYDEAVIAYRDFIRNYPASARVADAQYAMAEALEKLGRWVEAMDAYQTFRDKFASHPKAPAAKEQEMWIKAYRM